MTKRTRAVYDDGAFLLRLSTELPEPWELVRKDGVVCSAPLVLVHGEHGLTIEPTCEDVR
jgi:hypothetical protein